MRAAVKRYVLYRPKLRQSWNKYNLYNIMKYEPNINYQEATFFQQKWAAKSMTRAYHGEHVQEKKWCRLFKRRLNAAVDMPPAYLAAHDGSEQAAGRGSGREHPPDAAEPPVSAYTYSAAEAARQEAVAKDRAILQRKVQRMRPGPRTVKALFKQSLADMTPYMQMTFAPLERRLETAIFRAMFACSPRQARQFCVHGAVTVNGKKMRYGSYMLNPGDMFQVDPEKVMYATGRNKDQARLEAEARRRAAIRAGEIEETDAAAESSEAATPAEGEDAEAKEEDWPDLQNLPAEEREKEQRRRVRALVRSANALLTDDPAISVKRKKELRAFLKTCKKVIGDKKGLRSENVMEQLAGMLSKYKLDGSGEAVVDAEAEKEQQAAPRTEEDVKALTKAQQKRLAKILVELENDENVYDPSKPYATPWSPRKYLKSFAFIPRYLEVNQNICAAVYLRHPVARRGMAEVPTPFPYDVNQLAYTWYLRRR